MLKDGYPLSVSCVACYHQEKAVKRTNSSSRQSIGRQKFSFRDSLESGELLKEFVVTDDSHIVHLTSDDHRRLQCPKAICISLPCGELYLSVVVIPDDDEASKVSLLPTIWFKWILSQLDQDHEIQGYEHWENISLSLERKLDLHVTVVTQPDTPTSYEISLRPLSLYPWIPVSQLLSSVPDSISKSQEYQTTLIWFKNIHSLIGSQNVYQNNLVCIPKNNRKAVLRIEVVKVPCLNSTEDSLRKFEILAPLSPFTTYADVYLSEIHKIPSYLLSVAEDISANIGTVFKDGALYQKLNISPIRGAYLMGPVGSGRRRIIRQIAAKFQARLFHLSLSEMISWYERGAEGTSPLERIVTRACLSSPSIVMLEGFDLLNSDMKHIDAKSITQHLIISLSKAANQPVFIVGIISSEINRLPSSLHLNHASSFGESNFCFGSKFDVPLPISSEQRNQALLLACQSPSQKLDLDKDVLDVLGLETTGRSLADLERIVATIGFHLREREPPVAKTDMDDITQQFNSIHLNKKSPKPLSIAQDVLEKYNQYIEQKANSGDHNPYSSTHVKRYQTTWDDIYGYKSTKGKLQRFLTLTDSSMIPQLEKLGMRPPAGLLLFGPSGCGKTLLMKALATASRRTCISLDLKNVYSKFLGESEETIRSIFNSARKLRPSLIIMDNLDSIGTRRGWNSGASGSENSVNERVLSTLLNELDGIQGREGVLVVGCTNAPWLIDDALLRPGRLDEHIFVSLPTAEDRSDILEQIIPESIRKSSEEEDLKKLIEWTDGFTPADLTVLIREAIFNCLSRLESQPTTVNTSVSASEAIIALSLDDILATLEGGTTELLLHTGEDDVDCEKNWWWAPGRISKGDMDRYEVFAMNS